MGKLATSLAVSSALRLLVTDKAVPTSPIFVTLMMGRYVPPKRPFLQELHGATSQKEVLFIITAVKTSILTNGAKLIFTPASFSIFLFRFRKSLILGKSTNLNKVCSLKVYIQNTKGK
jgi:hypothetical protein